MISRMLSTPVFEAASISTTSGWRLSMISRQCRPWHGKIDRSGDRCHPCSDVVQRARQDAGRRRLADAAHAGQHVGLRDALDGERIPQRRHHRVLADQVIEGLRPVFAGEHDIGGRCDLWGAPE